MQLLTERGINVNFFPVKKNVEGNYFKEKNDKLIFLAQKGSRWTLRCYKLMDFLSSNIRVKFENIYKNTRSGNIPRYPNHPFILESFGPMLELPFENLNNYQKYLDGDQNYIYLKNAYAAIVDVPISEITKITSYTTDAVLDTVKIASNCLVKTEYAVHSIIKRKPKGDDFIFGFKKWNNFGHSQNQTNFERLFNYEVIDGEIKNGRMYNRIIRFKFNTILGACFIHNVYTGAYQLLDDIPLYKLTESSQIIYRKHILFYPRLGITLNSKTITNTLGLISNNKTERKRVFKRVIEELLDFQLIKIIERYSSGSVKLKFNRNEKEREKVTYMFSKSNISGRKNNLHV